MTNRQIYDELEILSPPAETIHETMLIMQMNTYSFADQMGLPVTEAVQLLNLAYPITEAIAIKLEHVLKVPRSFWLERERQYRDKLNFLHEQLKLNAENNG